MTCLSLFGGICRADEVEYYCKRVPVEYEEADDEVEYYYKKVPVKKAKKTTEEVVENEPEYTYKKVGVRRKKKEATQDNSTYFSIKGGLANIETNFEDIKGDAGEFLVSTALGMKQKDFRSEIELVYHHAGNFSAKNFSIMANAYYDIPLNEKIKPFINAGIGVSITKASIVYYYGPGYLYSEDETEFDFAWNVGAGISIQANENVNVVYDGGSTNDTNIEPEE